MFGSERLTSTDDEVRGSDEAEKAREGGALRQRRPHAPNSTALWVEFGAVTRRPKRSSGIVRWCEAASVCATTWEKLAGGENHKGRRASGAAEDLGGDARGPELWVWFAVQKKEKEGAKSEVKKES